MSQLGDRKRAKENNAAYAAKKSAIDNDYNTGEINFEQYKTLLKNAQENHGKSGNYESDIAKIQIIEDTEKSENLMDEFITYSKEQDKIRNDFATEQFDYQKGLAEKADKQKQDIANEMLAESGISKEEYDSEIGKATSTVKQSFANANDSNIRSARRMGLKPNSGRFKAMDRGNEIAEAANTASAQNSTRSGLKAFGENKKDNARRVMLGLKPLALNVNDQRTSMVGQTGGALNSGAGFAANSAARLQGQQNFNRTMDFQLKQFNDRPSMWEQATVNSIGGLFNAGGSYFGAKAGAKP